MDKLENKNQTPQNEDKQVEELVNYLELKTHLEFLASKGFTNIKHNLKFLHKCKYDQEKALKKLEEKKNLKVLKEFDKVEEYKKLYPGDKECDWKKFKSNSKRNRDEEKLKKKEVKYKTLFPDDKEYDWDKFHAQKHLLKKMKKEKKERNHSKKKNKRERKDKMIFDETPDNFEGDVQMSNQLLLTLCPNDKKADINSLKEIKKEARKKLKEQKYRSLFPDDKEFDWDRFKKEKKIRREKDNEAEKLLLEEWKDSFKGLYLDGNNMLYDDVRGGFRNLDFKKLENDIATLAENFSSKKKLNLLTVYFDFTKNVYSKTLGDLKLNVLSARPDFKSSDDALVELAGRLSASELQTSVFVTHDRGLKARLREKGASNIMRPKKWMSIAREEVGEKKFNELIPEAKKNSSESDSEHSS